MKTIAKAANHVKESIDKINPVEIYHDLRRFMDENEIGEREDRVKICDEILESIKSKVQGKLEDLKPWVSALSSDLEERD